MKSTGMKTITGTLGEDEGLFILDNTKPNMGWKVRDIRCMPNNPDELSAMPDKYFAVRLATASGLGAASFDIGNNLVIGAATYVAGVMSSMFDDDQLITNQLVITNMDKAASVTDPEVAFQISLESFVINDYEQVVSQIKETAQSGINQ